MLYTKPIELKDCQAFVTEQHRHLKKVVIRDKFRVAAYDETGLVGVVQVSRPRARMLDNGLNLEVVRVAIIDDRERASNCVSFLLGRVYQIAKAMGYQKLVSYILDIENGHSYKASGWVYESDTKGGLGWENRGREPTEQPGPKQRWCKIIK